MGSFRSPACCAWIPGSRPRSTCAATARRTCRATCPACVSCASPLAGPARACAHCAQRRPAFDARLRPVPLRVPARRTDPSPQVRRAGRDRAHPRHRARRTDSPSAGRPRSMRSCRCRCTPHARRSAATTRRARSRASRVRPVALPVAGSRRVARARDRGAGGAARDRAARQRAAAHSRCSRAACRRRLRSWTTC